MCIAWTISGMFACDTTRMTPRVHTRAGTAVHWTNTEIVLQPVVPTSGISATDLRDALEQARHTWLTALTDVDAPQIRISKPVRGVGRVLRDGRNIVRVRSGSWCPDRYADEDECYDARRSGITHLYPHDEPGSPADGQIGEADIEINAVDFRWSRDGKHAGTYSLDALLAHEMGHILGLNHDCAEERDKDLGLEPCKQGAAKQRIMYPYPIEQGKHAVLKPSTADLAAIRQTYAPREYKAAGCQVTEATDVNWVYGISAVICGLVRRRRT